MHLAYLGNLLCQRSKMQLLILNHLFEFLCVVWLMVGLLKMIKLKICFFTQGDLGGHEQCL